MTGKQLLLGLLLFAAACGGGGGGDEDDSRDPCSTNDLGCANGRCKTVETCVDSPRCDPEVANSSFCYQLTSVTTRNTPESTAGRRVKTRVDTRRECTVSGSPDPDSVDFTDPACMTITFPPTAIVEECDASGDCVIIPGPIT